MSNVSIDAFSNSSLTNSRNYLSSQQRQLIFQTMLKHVEGGKLKRGIKLSLAREYNVNRKTIYRIWQQGKHCVIHDSLANVSLNYFGQVGRKRVELDIGKILEVPLRLRKNIRSLSKAIDIPRSTVHRRIHEGALRAHTNAIKPQLTVGNKKTRIEFCLSFLKSQGPNENLVFDDMLSYVHIDEKLFYLTKETQRYYLAPNEREPTRTCKSKRFIPKVMFMAAVARPRYDHCHGNEFSGKIGIFPFTYKEPAKRNSKNRVAGTLETKPILSITKEVTRSFLLEKVLPAIKSKWPCCCFGSKIIIQQDNAKPHLDPNDEAFILAGKSDGFDIQLRCQPPNSPDLNVLDLGFFRAIQSLQQQEALGSIDELVAAVEKSFNEIPSDSLNDVFLSLQQSMIEILKVSGDNGFHVPHMGKQALRREGNLPLQLECDRAIVDTARLAL